MSGVNVAIYCAVWTFESWNSSGSMSERTRIAMRFVAWTIRPVELGPATSNAVVATTTL